MKTVHATEMVKVNVCCKGINTSHKSRHSCHAGGGGIIIAKSVIIQGQFGPERA